MELNDTFWSERYLNGDTGWDLNGVSPPLKEYIDKLDDKEISILIPGCGNAYEAEYLLNKGFRNVTLIDISKELTDSLKEKFSGKSIAIIHDDFFKHQGHYNLILEQTFFCAIDPALRKDYVKQIVALLNEDGKLAGVLFSRLFDKPGPPFGGTPEEYKQLFSDYFDFVQFADCKTSVKPRLGNELFIEFKKQKQ